MNIRTMQEKDKSSVMEMMETFYSSPAVWTNGSKQIFENDIAHCLNGSPYLEGFVFEQDGGILGYAMIAKSFSTEFGKPCIWIEDIYIKPDFRGQGIASAFFHHLNTTFQNCIFRLEVEPENTKAIRTYEKNGFTILPYMEMKK